jgi:lysozyme family protein
MGITLATYQEWSHEPNLGDVQVKDTTPKTARMIYRSVYWTPLRAGTLPPGVNLGVFDMGINAGIRPSTTLLQEALGFTGDGVVGAIGPETLAIADRFHPRTLVNKLGRPADGVLSILGQFPHLWHRLAPPRQSATRRCARDDPE